MLEIIKEVAAVLTALTIIIGTLYSVANVYSNKKKEVIKKYEREKEYKDLKENVLENHRNILRIELLLLITNESPKQLVWEIYDKYKSLHGNSYIKKIVYKYCDDENAKNPLF
jgi:predicted nucleotide-binding protein (sugar kinase/HSP70/actin superfamily)